MDEKYMYLIIGYDFGDRFSENDLACDEAYEIAKKIIGLYKEATGFFDYCSFYNFVMSCLNYYEEFKQKK